MDGAIEKDNETGQGSGFEEGKFEGTGGVWQGLILTAPVGVAEGEECSW